MTSSAYTCRTLHVLAETADYPWLAGVRFADVLRVIVAWDRLTQCVPDGQPPVEYLHRHTSGLTPQRLHHLRRTRNACAHPHMGPRSQKDLDRALATARRALGQLPPGSGG